MHKVTEMLQVIRSALVEEPDELHRRRAVNACDELLAALGGAKASEKATSQTSKPIVTMPPAPTPAPISPTSQMLDALIAKLQSELTKREQPVEPIAQPELRIPFVPLPADTGKVH